MSYQDLVNRLSEETLGTKERGEILHKLVLHNEQLILRETMLARVKKIGQAYETLQEHSARRKEQKAKKLGN